MGTSENKYDIKNKSAYYQSSILSIGSITTVEGGMEWNAWYFEDCADNFAEPFSLSIYNLKEQRLALIFFGLILYVQLLLIHYWKCETKSCIFSVPLFDKIGLILPVLSCVNTWVPFLFFTKKNPTWCPAIEITISQKPETARTRGWFSKLWHF